MNLYEQLEAEACKDGIEIIHYDFQSDNIKGIYCDGTIGINKNLRTTAEKACVLSEELGHHYTTVGDILDQDDAWHRKQERQARFDGYKRLITLVNLIDAYESGCQNSYEIAEHLNVTEEYLQECIDCYRDKYGVVVTVGEYHVVFIPHLMILKKI